MCTHKRAQTHTLTTHARTDPEHEVITMPALSPTMEVGTISKWQV